MNQAFKNSENREAMTLGKKINKKLLKYVPQKNFNAERKFITKYTAVAHKVTERTKASIFALQN